MLSGYLLADSGFAWLTFQPCQKQRWQRLFVCLAGVIYAARLD